TSTLNHRHDDLHALTTTLAQLHTTGTDITWTPYYDNPVPPLPDLPTYPFQRQRFWLDAPTPVHTTELSDLGLDPSTHPVLATSIQLPDGEALFTGRLSLRSLPWLTDHAVVGTAVLPAAAIVELALWAGGRSGCGVLDDLVLAAPLALPETGGVQVQLHVGRADHVGRRPVELRSRPMPAGSGDAEDTSGERSWMAHATGTLSPAGSLPPRHEDTAEAGATSPWPPSGAEPIEVGDAYQRLSEHGYGYGPAFQGLRAAWRHEGDLYAEIALPSSLHGTAHDFTLHPTLLDAALHVLALDGLSADDVSADEVTLRLPYSWSGVRLYASDALSLRVRLSLSGADTARLTVTNEDGAAVADVEALVVRGMRRGRLATLLERQTALFRDGHRSLFHLVWEPLPVDAAAADSASWPVISDAGATALLGPATGVRYPDIAALSDAVAAGAEAPGLVLLPWTAAGSEDVAARAHDAVFRVHAVLRDLLADDRLADTRLAVVTRNAIATSADENVGDLAAAPLWGLLRTAQTENPDRFRIIDIDANSTSHDNLATALASAEPQLALRSGQPLTPRIIRSTTPPTPPTTPPAFDTEGTVLITGGTGSLGSHLARHLITTHGAKHLLLTSRRGPHAPGAAQLHTELLQLGAEHVHIAACDTADHQALADLLATIPADHPLTAVIHTAGTLHDATLTTLTPTQLTTVLRPKINAAWNLHHLTKNNDLTLFALFSSIAGTVGSAGQANYAAANTFLDALAHHRHHLGLPATSLAWGLWDDAGMGAALEGAELARMRRIGVVAMDPAEGLGLFDDAVADARPALIPARLDIPALQSAHGPVPHVLRGLAGVGAAGGDTSGRAGLSARGTHRSGPVPDANTGGRDGERITELLAAHPEGEWRELVLHVVRDAIAAVLGHAAPSAIDDDRGLLDLGFDSLTAVELRNRLGAETGLRLPTTVVFDYPTAGALADHLRDELAPLVRASGTTEASDATVLAQLDLIESSLPGIALDEQARAAVADRLRRVLGHLDDSGAALGTADKVMTAPLGAEELGDASDDEIFRLIDTELGTD
ncbi:SDR family NAD(P)-dependent oxidoreductase, partial [Streptomyces sp. NPDC017082]|uniref:type I polyketide synthase n=1 Tax=Streptomyces sp. NPDC017082 TaxID=3364974 RepID=UPI0037A4EC12